MEQESKPRFVAFIASSVDGRISLRKKTMPNWTSEEDWKFFQESLSNVDAVVVGRNTYQATAMRLRERTTYVFSSRLKTLRRRGSVTFLNPARVDLGELFGRHKTIAVLGGGMAYGFMLENNFLDELYITFEPLIFGRGKEMVVGGTRTARLHLLSMRRLNRSGSILLHYQVER